MKDAIDYGIVVSDFNKKDLIDMGYQCPIAVAPILIPFKDYEQEPDKDVVTLLFRRENEYCVCRKDRAEQEV